MKVQPATKPEAPRDPKSGRTTGNQRIGRDFLIVFLTGVITTVFAIGYAWPVIVGDFTNWTKARGFLGTTIDEAQAALAALPRNLVSSRPPIPKLTIDIKFKHFEKLREKRAEALKRRYLITAKDDFVPAKIRMDGRGIKVSVRLKGDMIDHLEGSKWSLRIKVKGGEQVLGMRRFSIQSPHTRGFQSEGLFLESLRMAGLIVPRYRFVDVTLNGNNIGIMALEEHFSNELLAAHGRREGVIVRFNESFLWDAELRDISRFEHKFNQFQLATVKAFRSSKIGKSKRLAKNYATSVGLLRAFAARELQASDVFDPDLLGRFIALADLWGARHVLFWNNMRFYLNPISLKHEVIGFDATLQKRPRRLESISRITPIAARMLEDPRVFEAYEAYLRKFGEEIINGDLIAKLRDFEQKQVKEFAHEFYLTSPYPLDELRIRAEYLLGLTQDALRLPPIKAEDYPILVYAHLVEDKGKRYLELANATSYDIEVRSIYWSAGDKSEHIAFETQRGLRFPIKLGPNKSATDSNSIRIAYRPPTNDKDLALRVMTAFKSLDRVRESIATPYFPLLDKPPLQTETVGAQSKKHPFLQTDKTNNLMRVRPGVWNVTGSIHVPRGFTLSVPKGTTLKFNEGEGIVAFGPVHLRGTSQQPIVLEGRKNAGEAKSWNGVAVLQAGETSSWTHAVIRNTRAVSRTNWELTGGVTFYRSDVQMSGCRFEGSTAEDALNIVNSQFTLTGVTIENTVSDGLDADFSKGEIHNGLFRNIGAGGGGDAVDVSGSDVTVNGTTFQNIDDKALSVGEGSTMTAKNIVIANAATGAASKDGSKLIVEGADISGANVAGLMAYIKKQEYGSASIVARNTQFHGNKRDAWSQTRSTITIDSKPVVVQDIDVDRLYETAMKPARKR